MELKKCVSDVESETTDNFLTLTGNFPVKGAQR
jgi:hypothetical protein